jgi:hypothetical protein
MVDEKRIEELIAKRQETGLSDGEADELGKLFAEREGKPYSNAKLSKLPPGERGSEFPTGDTAGANEPQGTEETQGQPPEPKPSDMAPDKPPSPMEPS